MVLCWHVLEVKTTEHPQNLIHTSYVNHDNNDLRKFINVLDACRSNSYMRSISARLHIWD